MKKEDHAKKHIDELIIQLIENKNNQLKSPQSPEFMMQIKSLLGKSSDENELNELTKLKNEDFSKKIKDIFEKKRNERIKH